MDQITASGIGVGVGGGVFDGSGVTVGAKVGVTMGVLVDFGMGVLLTGSGDAVTTTMTDLGVGVGSHDVRARITRTTNPKMITGLPVLRIDLVSIIFPQVMLRSPKVLPVFQDYSLITISISWKMTTVLKPVSIQVAKNPNFHLGFMSIWS